VLERVVLGGLGSSIEFGRPVHARLFIPAESNRFDVPN